jgi:hypothetical protein
LIKDYDLEVHYHPGKANVIADALSHKAHCNYMLVVRLTGEESSTRVLPNLSLFNITLMPTLRDEIIAVQKNSKGMGHIKQRMQEGDPKVACFHKDAEGTRAYKLDLPPSLAGVHDIFHVSQLKKYLKAPMDIVLLEMTPLEADLSYPKQ